MTFRSPTTAAFNITRSLLIFAMLAPASCNSDAKEPKVASIAGAPATGSAAAKPAPAPAPATTATAAGAAAQPTGAGTCIRPGTYRATSKGPFFLADEAGKLPPAPERKQKLDAVRDCEVHPSFDVTMTVAMDGTTPAIAFADEMLRAENIVSSDCHLRFDVRVDDAPTMLSRAAFDLDFSTASPTATAKNVWLSIRLDGEAGENVVDCAAESIPIVLATTAGK